MKSKPTKIRPWLACVVLCVFAAALQPRSGLAQQNSTPSHDGQHDFDFEIGSWNIHLKKLDHPLSGSPNGRWTDFDGTSVTQKIWDGRAQIEQFETDGALGHIEGLTLRLYNPQTHQWRLYWANVKNGALDPQPMVGEFKNGVGEFYDQESFNGRMIYVRFIWSATNTDKPHFEQSYSDDGGKTWEANWITDQTRVPAKANWRRRTNPFHAHGRCQAKTVTTPRARIPAAAASAVRRMARSDGMAHKPVRSTHCAGGLFGYVVDSGTRKTAVLRMSYQE